MPSGANALADNGAWWSITIDAPDPIREYIYLGDTLLASLTLTTATPVLTYYHTDVLGSVREITNTAGASVMRHDFGPWGGSASALTGDPRRFLGLERDPETALDYMAARYYRPVWGRFMAPDPGQASGRPEDPQGWNAYAYARNNPLRYVDPTGLEYEVYNYWNNVYNIVSDREWESSLSFMRCDCWSQSGSMGWTYIYERGRLGAIIGYRKLSDDENALQAIERAGAWAKEGIEEYVKDMAINAAAAGAGVGLRWALESASAALDSAALQKLVKAGVTTSHVQLRIGQRAITAGHLAYAVKTAIANGQVTRQMGKYGTAQLVYSGLNGLKVIVETQGRNAGKIITAYWY